MRDSRLRGTVSYLTTKTTMFFARRTLTPRLFTDINSSLRRFVLAVLILVMFLPPKHVTLCPLFTICPDK